MNIVITGASRGIGFETAKIISKNHTVVAIARDLSKLKKLKSCNEKIEIFKCDISNKNAISDFVSFYKKRFSSLDILINNAGFLVNKSFEKISEKDIETTFEANFFGVIRLTQMLLPLLKKSKHPHIVNIGSMGGFQGSAKFPGLSIYSSSKAALACLSECLAEEFKKEKIKVNCLALGAAQTEMLSQAFPNYKAPFSAKQMAEFIAEFSISGHQYFNGKVLPVSVSTP